MFGPTGETSLGDEAQKLYIDKNSQKFRHQSLFYFRSGEADVYIKNAWDFFVSVVACFSLF